MSDIQIDIQNIPSNVPSPAPCKDRAKAGTVPAFRRSSWTLPGCDGVTHARSVEAHGTPRDLMINARFFVVAQLRAGIPVWHRYRPVRARLVARLEGRTCPHKGNHFAATTEPKRLGAILRAWTLT